MKSKQEAAGLISAPAIFTDKLASSGLTLEDAEVLGMKFLDDCSKIDSQFLKVRGILIPYFGIDGKQTDFYRIRYLDKPSGFAGQVAKPQRYAQAAGTLNEAYLAPLAPWESIALRPDIDILITEGELKGAKGTKCGVPCIALGGVNTWSSSKRNIDLLEPLPQINWKGRTVTIVFDSDAASNPNVALAQVSLAKKLLALGALPRIASLPTTSSGEKQGLDDFLVAGGEIEEILKDTRGLALGERLSELNSRFAYVIDQDLIVERVNGRRIRRESFCNGHFANNNITEYLTSGNGNVKKVEVKVPMEWLRWTARTDVKTMTFKPGKPSIEDGEYNTWAGWAVEPNKGNIKPWTELLSHIFGDEIMARDWFEQWIAYPMQNPGAKMFTSVVIWGPEQGTGKSLIGYTIGSIYGDNFTEIGNAELHSTFNEWAINRQFVMGDEITGSDRRTEADKIKAMITQKLLRINMKNLPTYTVPDCINYYFTSNHPAAFFLDDQDRRFMIHRTAQKKAEAVEFYDNYIRWKDNGGTEALFDYFLNLDLSSFNPTARAPTTASKLELIDHGRSDLNQWVYFFMENLDLELPRLAEYLGVPETDLDLVLNKHLKWLYDPNDNKRVTSNGIGREMSRCGAKTLPQTRTDTFGKQRFYVLRNEEKWLNAKPDTVREHVDKVFAVSEAMAKVSKF
jgi:hypothetical protein